ncbi:crotonase/enoyl-CoA hydratase family protein [Paludibacterium yongneupense]|uniref:crotonase/enoyl-CoA hydratase family protein n=1 Tax=Paludibacterium yongneupense TaxID=400061 RepID=UPI00040B7B9E|nr:crotonase/enoyl-CoA hydratase family protein [Paludibacterium yongneupense]
MQFRSIHFELRDGIAIISLNRPDKANALDDTLWQELRAAMESCDEMAEVRVIVLAGEGRHFCAGIDLGMLMGVQAAIRDDCEARKREKLRRLILELQATASALERCGKPVIAAIHGACLGGGLDIALAADFRYATQDAIFSVRELDLAMVADIGTLQRLPRIVGEGVAREMVLTARDVGAIEAQGIGLVNRIYPDVPALRAAALACAHQIAARSPLAVRGCKQVLNFSRDHSVADGLEYVATWNAAMLLSDDLPIAAMAMAAGDRPRYRD